jgi:hypothetical protein
VLAGELAGLVEQAHDAQGVHAPEHALDARRRHVAEGHPGFGGDALAQVALARARRPLEQQTTDRLTAHLLEALDAAHQRDHLAGGLEHLGVAHVVLEADARFAGHQPVDAWLAQEPEQRHELDDHEHDREEELEDQVQPEQDVLAPLFPVRGDHEQADERQDAQNEQRSNERADPTQGLVDLPIEIVVWTLLHQMLDRNGRSVGF